MWSSSLASFPVKEHSLGKFSFLKTHKKQTNKKKTQTELTTVKMFLDDPIQSIIMKISSTADSNHSSLYDLKIYAAVHVSG